MNDIEKQGKLRIFLGKEKWDIAIITETKLIEQKGKYIFKGWDKYECINSSFNNDNTKSGIIILIRKSLNDRRYKVEKIDGHVIKLDLLFKDKQKGIKIIGVYNPNNDQDTTRQIEKRITTWINEAQKLNQELVILGDFNESANNKKKSKPVTQTIKKHGLEDVHECLAGKDMLDTWKSREHSSRIDYIFASEGILRQILSHEIIDIEDFKTDHKALTIKIELKESIELNRKEYFKQIKAELKRIKLESEDWEIIAERFDDKLLEITETDINREEMWETMVAIYEEEKNNRIKELKEIKEKEKENENDNKKLEELIKEYETLEKINNIEHEIIKLVRKVVKTKWKERDGKSEKQYKSFDEQLTIEDWGTTDTGKFNAKKVISLIKAHDKIETNKERLLNIEHLRKYEKRKELEEREKERNKYMIKLYKEINDRIIEINIRKREIYLEEDIEKDQEKIKEITLEHYSKWTAKRDINLDEIEFNYEWREIYKPLETISTGVYKKLMEKIEMEELETVIKNLKSNKAPGMSGISYDFWKKSKNLTRQILLAIINESMEKGNATEKWKRGLIYPINKTTRSHWNQDLSLTRPIVLLETARKIWFKILVNRLSEILSKNRILTDTNYAALKNESTLEPIKIIQHIIEDANRNGKEAWILFMDISKAYDSVNIQMLELSMKRIGLPEKFINLVLDISLNRYNRILVNNEMTDEYYVEDGLDQGEVWSPILWRIFYDALLARLDKIRKSDGYNINEDKIINLRNGEVDNLNISINVTAFMDDTTIISNNKKNLEKMIDICHQFFNINDIKANVGKYELIKINSKEKALEIEGNEIKKMNSEEGNRYLGIYFRYDNKRKIYKDKISSIINSACNIFNWKKLNEKQIIAVWNIVIIPRIEYQLAAIVLTKSECTKLMTRLNMIIKKRARLARSTPNFVIYDKDIYDVKHIYDLQLEMLCKNLLYQANGNEKLKKLFKIVMSQEQKRIWTSRCPGDLNLVYKIRNNWNIEAIKLLNSENIYICNHEVINNINKHHIIEGGDKDIIEIIDEKNIMKSALSRKNKKVLFIKDVLEIDGVNMKKWKHMCIELGVSTKGKIPLWFKELELKLIDNTNENTRKIKKEYMGKFERSNININYFDENEKQEKNTIISWNEEGEFPVFAEDKKGSKSKKYKRIGIHYTYKEDTLDWNNSPFLVICEGCEKNISKKKDKKCMIYIENKNSRIIKTRKEGETIKPYETINNLIQKNKCVKAVNEDERKNEEINRKIDQIDSLIKAEDDFITLMKNSLTENETGEKVKRYYLMIELKKIKSSINANGKRAFWYNIIWILKEDNANKEEEILMSASYEICNENEFKILIRSIIIGLILINGNSEIILGINENIKKLIKEFIFNTSNRKKIDNDYYIELLYIEDFMIKNEIIMVDETNEEETVVIKDIRKRMEQILKKDLKEKKMRYKIEIIENALLINEYNLIWRKNIITGGFRKWRKKVSMAIWKNEILNSNKLNDLFIRNFMKEFDWRTTLEFISNRTTFTKRQCSSIDTKERSYRIKNLLKDLPTYEVLCKREVEVLENSTCIRCDTNEEETWDHVWICNDNEATLDEILRESISKFEEFLDKNRRLEDVLILRNHNINIVTILEERSNILIGKSRIWEMLRGVFNDRFNHITKVKEELAIIKECWNFIYNEYKNRIWLIRCEEIARLEKLKGIQKQDLKKKKKRRREQDIREEDVEDENIENKKTNKKDKKNKKRI
ncbi:unnamed protein product [Rhizophagus irregularis]|nr:unnamed protein product [Rhizophagus irregularis]